MFPIVNTYMNAAFKREHCHTRDRIRPVFQVQTYIKAAFKRVTATSHCFQV